MATPPVKARPLTIAESALLLGTCERVVSLLALDEMWTEYLTAARESRIAEIDFKGLSELAQQMIRGLQEIAQIGPRAAELVSSQYDETLFEGLERVREQYGPAELFDWLLDGSAGASLRDVFVSAWTWVLNNTNEESNILQEKQGILSIGNLCDPDFRFRFRCMLVVAGIAATATLGAVGVVATVGVGAAVGLGAIATAGGTALAWKDSGCAKEVRPAHS